MTFSFTILADDTQDAFNQAAAKVGDPAVQIALDTLRRQLALLRKPKENEAVFVQMSGSVGADVKGELTVVGTQCQVGIQGRTPEVP